MLMRSSFCVLKGYRFLFEGDLIDEGLKYTFLTTNIFISNMSLNPESPKLSSVIRKIQPTPRNHHPRTSQALPESRLSALRPHNLMVPSSRPQKPRLEAKHLNSTSTHLTIRILAKIALYGVSAFTVCLNQLRSIP